MSEARGYISFGRELGHRIRRMIDLFAKPTPFLKSIGRVWIQRTKQEQFGPGGSPPFARLDPRYRRVKLKRYGHRPILTASGRMRRGMKFIIRGLFVLIGSPVKVGRWNLLGLHRSGTRRGMPRRDPFQRLSRRTEQTAVQQLEKQFLKRLRGM